MIKRILTTTLFLLVLSSFAKADFLLYLEQDRNDGSESYCIEQYYFKNQRIYFLQSGDNKYDSKRLSRYATVSIEAGYTYENNICELSNMETNGYEAVNNLPMTYNNFSFLGIPLEYFNTLMALSGLVISSIFLYGLTRFI